MGSFKWKAMNLEYKCENTQAPTRELTERVIGQFRAAGCNAR
jgi:pyruvate formate lyase activating enzyme